MRKNKRIEKEKTNRKKKRTKIQIEHNIKTDRAEGERMGAGLEVGVAERTAPLTSKDLGGGDG